MRQHVLLTSEGLAYFSIALLDFLVHVIPAVDRSLGVFKPLDILTGAASSIPLLLYTLFLYFFTASDFIPTLPEHFRIVARYSLLFLIPEIIAANELASFVSISYRIFGNTVEVGFVDQATHIGFDSLTLGLLIVFQMIVFTIAFYRLEKAFENRRNIKVANRTGNGAALKAHLFNGLGWIVAGTLLGSIESMVGLAEGGFALALTRRILRLLGHSSLIIGVFNGMDTVEDFHIFKLEAGQQRRRSRLLALISSPRQSTFYKVSGYQLDTETGRPVAQAIRNRLSSATSDIVEELRSISIRFQPGATPRSSVRATEDAGGSSGFTYITGSYSNTNTSTRATNVHPRPGTPPLLTSGPPVPRIPRPQRVTIHYGQGRPPILELRRFSDLLDIRSLVRLTQVDPYIDPYNLHTQSLPAHVAMQGLGVTAPARRSSPTLPSLPTNYATEDASGVPPLRSATDSQLSIAPSSAIISSVVRADRVFARHTYSGPQSIRQGRERTPSSPSDSMDFVHAIAEQFPDTPQTPKWFSRPDRRSMPEEVLSTHKSSGSEGTVGTLGGPLARQERSFEQLARALASADHPVPETPGQPTGETRGAQQAAAESPAMRMSDESQTAAAFPTPISMDMPSPRAPQRPEEPNTSTERTKRRARRISARASRALQDIGNASGSRAVGAEDRSMPPARSMPVRIKSVGNAPMRWTPTPTSSSMSTRDSVAVELGAVSEQELAPRRRPRKRSTGARRKSVIPTVLVAEPRRKSTSED
ncbi:uncharacterized protein LAESUDRAFT_77405 [Laetiporus sulphureus 93-53]|uniref:Uncharacterized protein n=1 Tax=Laetiporus sulphureus 93-53 TaxID=1314785 RepID=A0A165F0Z8_9APHY|nr:uncharacterized protein LAESUDRAFT_77405 [Laetiporus sulphureus 93-53]KZT08137.1 hypothetical protein LAESUDRAFT_77405 [Laetiporus sulphureus 93-53]